MEKCSISNINNGAVEEIFQECLRQLMLNIKDQNTDAGTTRSIILKLDFKPYEDRSGADVICIPTLKLPSVKKSRGQFFISARAEKLEGFTRNPAQEALFAATPANEKKI